MSNIKIIGANVPNMPWQDRPEGSGNLPVWRYNENPIIGRNPAKGVARIFNSAVMPYKDSFIGVFRGEQTNGIPYIYLGRSKDAIHWEFEEDKIPFKDENGNDFMPRYAYDPRLVKVEDTYYIMWCQDFYGASIGIAKTQDFETFTRIENPFIPFNRNAVLFRISRAFPNLPLDRFFTLVVGGVTSIDNSSHRFTSFLTGKLNISLHVHNY